MTEDEKNQPKPKTTKTIPCPKCGNEISIYYFTSVINDDGKIIDPKCQNCGYFEDPE